MSSLRAHAARVVLHPAARRVGQLEHCEQLGRHVRPRGHEKPHNLASNIRFSRPVSLVERRRTVRSWRWIAHLRAGGHEIVAHELAEPPSGFNKVASMRSSVVFRRRWGPRMPKIVPRGTSRSMPSTARKSPNVLARPRATMAAECESGHHVRGRYEVIDGMSVISDGIRLALRRRAWATVSRIGRIGRTSMLPTRAGGILGRDADGLVQVTGLDHVKNR